MQSRDVKIRDWLQRNGYRAQILVCLTIFTKQKDILNLATTDRVTSNITSIKFVEIKKTILSNASLKVLIKKN